MAGTEDTQVFRIDKFTTDGGIALPVCVAYRTYGEQVASRRVALVSTCFGEKLSDSNPLIGAGKAIDPFGANGYFVIKIGIFNGSDVSPLTSVLHLSKGRSLTPPPAGCSKSSSPSNTPAPFAGADFPNMTYGDNVRAQKLLLESLHIEKLHAVIGFSMGAQLAYHWGMLHGDMVSNIVVLCGSAQTSVHNIAFLEGPKAALIVSGDLSAGGKGSRAFGRAYCAWALSHDWFQLRKWEDGGHKSLEDYIMTDWEGAMGAWLPADLLALSWTWQNGDIASATVEPRVNSAAPFATVQLALNAMKPRALIMPTTTDLYFNTIDSIMEVKNMPKGGQYTPIESIYGHMAGGGGGTPADDKFIDEAVAKFLA